ncbi:TPA: hypothetical protein TZW71_001024 [Streptococcus suis]|nr:hypothetical protein [Streptococcus suis]HEL2447515.1 hypothetical protein [Streptococcus suis]
MVNALLDVTGFDKDKDEAFKLSLNVEKIIAIAEDTFVVFDDVAGEYKVKDKFVRC